MMRWNMRGTQSGFRVMANNMLHLPTSAAETLVSLLFGGQHSGRLRVDSKTNS